MTPTGEHLEQSQAERSKADVIENERDQARIAHSGLSQYQEAAGIVKGTESIESDVQFATRLLHYSLPRCMSGWAAPLAGNDVETDIYLAKGIVHNLNEHSASYILLPTKLYADPSLSLIQARRKQPNHPRYISKDRKTSTLKEHLLL